MSTTSPHLGLKINDGTDPFLRDDFTSNYNTLDKYPGNWICTSATRPVWGAAQTGMCITETDTRRTMLWTGSTWREMLYGPAMWWGSVRPGVRIGAHTYLSYVVGTFTVNRPGTLFTLSDIEFSLPSSGTFAANYRAMIDGAQANWDGDGVGEYFRAVWGTSPGSDINTLGYTLPAMGVRYVNAGTHSLGVAVSTQSTSENVNTTAQITSIRSMALFVNGTDR